MTKRVINKPKGQKKTAVLAKKINKNQAKKSQNPIAKTFATLNKQKTNDKKTNKERGFCSKGGDRVERKSRDR